MNNSEFERKRYALLMETQTGGTPYKIGMAHVNLAHLNRHQNRLNDAIYHYIEGANILSRINHVKAASLYEECVDICFQLNDIDLGVKCLRSAFECFQEVNWDDRCNSILERIIKAGRNDIADELIRFSAKHKAEHLLIQVKEFKKKIANKKINLPVIINQNILRIEDSLNTGDYASGLAYGEEAKKVAEELIADQSAAVKSFKYLESELREMMIDSDEEIGASFQGVKLALNNGEYKEAKTLADALFLRAKAMKIEEEEKKREEERKLKELEDARRREEEERRREEERRIKIMSKLDKLADAEPEPQDPKLSIEYTRKDKEFILKGWGEFNVEVTNRSPFDIKNLEVKIESGSMATTRSKKCNLLRQGEIHIFNMGIRPTELGDSVPLDIIVTCDGADGNTFHMCESTDGIIVVEKARAPAEIHHHTHIQSGGHMAIGSNFNNEGVQMKPSLQTGAILPGLDIPSALGIKEASKGSPDSTERARIYKEALKKWYVKRVDDDYMDNLQAQLKIKLREHENFEIEAQGEMREAESGVARMQMPAQAMPSLAAQSKFQSPKERYDPYKDALRKWYAKQLSLSELGSLRARYVITDKEHETLNKEVENEIKNKAKGEVAF